jgi:beta-lactamase class A
MDEQTRQQIMAAMMGGGLLQQGANANILRPIYDRLNIENQMQGLNPLPQYEDWYRQMLMQIQNQQNPSAPATPQPLVGGTPMGSR